MADCIRTDRYDGGHEKSPTEELEEYDDKGMINTWLIQSSLLKSNSTQHFIPVIYISYICVTYLT